jgi:hypothetical protein
VFSVRWVKFLYTIYVNVSLRRSKLMFKVSVSYAPVLRNVALHHWVSGPRGFQGTYHLHLQVFSVFMYLPTLEEGGGSLRNVGNQWPNIATSRSRKLKSSITLLRKSQKSYFLHHVCNSAFLHLQNKNAAFYIQTVFPRHPQSQPTLFLLKDPAADATDAPQPWRLIVQPYEEDDEGFSAFPF